MRAGWICGSWECQAGAGGAPGWLEEGDRAGDSLWSRGKAGMTTGIHQGLNQLQGAGIRALAGLGEAGKRGWDLFLGVPLQTWL